MNIFQFYRPLKAACLDILADGGQAVDDSLAFVSLQYADLLQHVGMCNRTSDILTIKASVEADRRGEALHKGIGGLRKTSAPQGMGGIIRGLIRVAHGRFSCSLKGVGL